MAVLLRLSSVRSRPRPGRHQAQLGQGGSLDHGGVPMPKLIATHEVDDVAHWLSSPKRKEVFGSVANDIRTFVDSGRPNQVGLTMDVGDMAAFEAVLQSE